MELGITQAQIQRYVGFELPIVIEIHLPLFLPHIRRQIEGHLRKSGHVAQEEIGEGLLEGSYSTGYAGRSKGKLANVVAAGVFRLLVTVEHEAGLERVRSVHLRH